MTKNCDGKKNAIVSNEPTNAMEGNANIVTFADEVEIRGCDKTIKTRYFVVSESPYINETFAFAADENGEILEWTEVAGGRDSSIDEVAKELERIVDEDGFLEIY